MSKTDTKISKHAKDIIQKYTSALFKDMTLSFYGIETAKIKELVNVELPVIEVSETSMDFVFLLEDDTYLHLEFQTTYNINNLTRFALYDLRLFERDGRKINTVIIYTSDIKKAVDGLYIGSLGYAPKSIMMGLYDGNAIYKELKVKISNNQNLEDLDILNLIFLPLMRNDFDKLELATESINLAQNIADKSKKDTCIASVFAFANRYLSDNEIGQLLEVLKMTDLATKLVEQAVHEDKLETAKKAIKRNIPIETIADITGLDIETVKKLKSDPAAE